MDANQDILRGKWNNLQSQMQQRWGKLTDDDLARLSGNTEELTCVLRQRYGYGQAQAEIEIKNWVSAHDSPVKP